MKKDNRKPQHPKNKNTIKKPSAIIPDKKSNPVFQIIIVFCLPVFLYLQTLSFDFTNFDDDGLIISNLNFLSHFENAPHAFLTDALTAKTNNFSFYRPMQTLSFMVDIQLSGGNNAWMYHLSNVLFLGLIACSLFILLKRFLIPPKLALLATLIFCVHPLFVSTVAFIPTRGDLMLTFFSLLSFIFLIDFLKNNKIIYLFFHWAAFTMALFCKETAALLPFLFILYYIIFIKEKHSDKKYFLIIISYGIAGMLWYWLRSKAIGDSTYSNGTYGITAIILNLRVIPESLSKLFLLFDIAPIPSFSILKTLAGIGIITLFTIIFFRNKVRTKKEILFCFAWFLLLMLPPMLYKHPVIDYLDHRSFLPLIGILLFLLLIFPRKWLTKGDIKRPWLLIVVIIILCSFTFVKSHSYSDPMTFFNSAVSQNPNSSVAYLGRGNVKSSRGDLQGALQDFSKGVSLSPGYDKGYYCRGLAELNMGDKAGALADFDKLISFDPNYAIAYNNKAVALYSSGNYKEAINNYNKALSLDSNYSTAYNNKGMALFSSGNFGEAILNYNKAIKINPDYLSAYFDRAIAKDTLKDFAGAIEDFENVLKLNPNHQRALQLKARAQQELKK